MLGRKMIANKYTSQLMEWAKKYQIDDLLNILKNEYDPKSQWGALLNIKSLDLSHKKLEAIPNCIFELSSLENLNLSHNHLSELPKEITKLTNLKFLDISWNHITHDIDFLPSNVQIKKAWNRK